MSDAPARKPGKQYGKATLLKSVTSPASRQIKDPWSKLRKEVASPRYDPTQLAQLMEVNPWHYACCRIKSVCVAGLGYHLRSIIDERALLQELEGIEGGAVTKGEKTRNRAEEIRSILAKHEDNKKRLEAFFSSCNDEMSFLDVVERQQLDQEAVGTSYFEVTRDATGKPAGLFHIPTVNMRVRLDEKGYIQIVGGKKRYFKHFGEDRTMDNETGEFKEDLPDEKQANEVIKIASYDPLSPWYGLAEVVPAILTISGDKAAKEYNNEFFDNSAVPAVVVVTEGYELDQDSQNIVRSYFDKDLKGKFHKTLYLSVPAPVFDQATQKEGSKPSLRIEKVATEIKDASFQRFRQLNREEVLAIHRVPPHFVALIESGNLGGGTGEAQIENFKLQVVKPKQERLEHIINNKLIRGKAGLGIDDWEIKFDEIDTTDEVRDSEIAERYHRIGVWSINEIRTHQGLDPIEGGDKHYIANNLTSIDAQSPETSVEDIQDEEGVEKNAPGNLRVVVDHLVDVRARLKELAA